MIIPLNPLPTLSYFFAPIFWAANVSNPVQLAIINIENNPLIVFATLYPFIYATPATFTSTSSMRFPTENIDCCIIDGIASGIYFFMQELSNPSDFSASLSSIFSIWI